MAVQDAAVGDHHDGVEGAAIVRVVQAGELVRQPGDGIALAAATLLGLGDFVPGYVVMMLFFS